MKNKFWNGGAEVYDKALRERYSAELAALQTQLKSAGSTAERQEVENKIASLKETHRQKSQAIRRGLF